MFSISWAHSSDISEKLQKYLPWCCIAPISFVDGSTWTGIYTYRRCLLLGLLFLVCSLKISIISFIAADTPLLHFKHLKVYGIIWFEFLRNTTHFSIPQNIQSFLLSLGIKPLSCGKLWYYPPVELLISKNQYCFLHFPYFLPSLFALTTHLRNRGVYAVKNTVCRLSCEYYFL